MGEHSDEILAELGYDEQQIAELRAAGFSAVRPRRWRPRHERPGVARDRGWVGLARGGQVS